MARRGRLEQAKTLAEAGTLRRAELSQRQVAKQLGVARSTLQGWKARAAAIDCPPALAQFLESPEGVQWLHRQVIAAHFAITLLGGDLDAGPGGSAAGAGGGGPSGHQR